MKNIIFKSFFILFISIALYSCTEDDVTLETQSGQPNTFPRVINFTELGKGYYQYHNNTVSLNQKVMIYDQPTFSNRITELHTLTGFINQNVNFNTEMVVFITDIIRPSTLYFIKITSINEYQDVIKVYYHTPEPGGGSATLTSSYYVCKIPKSTKPIQFINETP